MFVKRMYGNKEMYNITLDKERLELLREALDHVVENLREVFDREDIDSDVFGHLLEVSFTAKELLGAIDREAHIPGRQIQVAVYNGDKSTAKLSIVENFFTYEEVLDLAGFDQDIHGADLDNDDVMSQFYEGVERAYDQIKDRLEWVHVNREILGRLLDGEYVDNYIVKLKE